MLRAAVSVVFASWHASTPVAVGKGVELSQPLLALSVVVINVLLKVFASATHGWVALKWILAGEPPSSALVATFVLVAVNTQLLVTVSVIAHLRQILVIVATSWEIRIRFEGVGNLLQVGAGRAAVAVNAIATLVLCIHLHDRRWQLLPWLATAS